MRPHWAFRYFAGIVVWSAFAAWGLHPEVAASAPLASASKQSADRVAPVSHVIQISVDALGGKYLEKFLRESPEEFPNFARMIREGASTLNARTDFFRTSTLQNHTCMITGRPVLTPESWKEAKGHGLLQNSYPLKVESLHAVNPEGGYTASTFDVAHDHGLKTALYSGKAKFKIYASAYGEKFGRENPHGRNKVDSVITEDSLLGEAPPSFPVRVLEDLHAKHPAYVFLHYPYPDSVGHHFGYLGSEYRDAVKAVDGDLGDLLRLVENDPEWKGRTVIILTADHGGQPGTMSHGNAEEPYNYTLPFLVWGAGVAQGADLYQLNPQSRRDPGESRPEYAPTGQPIRNGDAGNLALSLLGLPPIPGSSINNKQDLSVR